MSNRYIDSADAATLQRLSAIFGLEYNPDMSLDEQRSQLKARKQMRFVINLQRIRNMLDEITHGAATVEIDYDALIMTVRVALTNKHNFASVKALLEDTVPQNLVLNVFLLYNQHDFLRHFTHKRLTEYTHRQLRADVLTFNKNSTLSVNTHIKLHSVTHWQLRKGDF